MEHYEVVENCINAAIADLAQAKFWIKKHSEDWYKSNNYWELERLIYILDNAQTWED